MILRLRGQIGKRNAGFRGHDGLRTVRGCRVVAAIQVQRHIRVLRRLIVPYLVDRNLRFGNRLIDNHPNAVAVRGQGKFGFKRGKVSVRGVIRGFGQHIGYARLQQAVIKHPVRRAVIRIGSQNLRFSLAGKRQGRSGDPVSGIMAVRIRVQAVQFLNRHIRRLVAYRYAYQLRFRQQLVGYGERNRRRGLIIHRLSVRIPANGSGGFHQPVISNWQPIHRDGFLTGHNPLVAGDRGLRRRAILVRDDCKFRTGEEYPGYGVHLGNLHTCRSIRHHDRFSIRQVPVPVRLANLYRAIRLNPEDDTARDGKPVGRAHFRKGVFG